MSSISERLRKLLELDEAQRRVEQSIQLEKDRKKSEIEFESKPLVSIDVILEGFLKKSLVNNLLVEVNRNFLQGQAHIEFDCGLLACGHEVQKSNDYDPPYFEPDHVHPCAYFKLSGVKGLNLTIGIALNDQEGTPFWFVTKGVPNKSITKTCFFDSVSTPLKTSEEGLSLPDRSTEQAINILREFFNKKQ